jgi:hypothetical protein
MTAAASANGASAAPDSDIVAGPRKPSAATDVCDMLDARVRRRARRSAFDGSCTPIVVSHSSLRLMPTESSLTESLMSMALPFNFRSRRRFTPPPPARDAAP